jgi:hypothetical protein
MLAFKSLRVRVGFAFSGEWCNKNPNINSRAGEGLSIRVENQDSIFNFVIVWTSAAIGMDKRRFGCLKDSQHVKFAR